MAKLSLKLPEPKSSKNIVDPNEGENDTPVWCFRGLKKGYTFRDISDKESAKKLTEALERRRALSWRDLLRRDPKTDGIVLWEKSKLKKEPPPEYRNEPKFLKFYAGITGARVVGWRRGRTFEVIWIDFKLDVTEH